ncbi:MAG: phosphopyruvate hydratase [Candidatus Levybacteria bacterium]|nr:phosphopyruvate hydratase [Candidatus Levybacteria bacterium]
MAKIKTIDAREILNAKGLPTVEAAVTLSDGKIGVASCPSGKIIGDYEALELKDHDANRFQGQGVLKAVGNIKNIIAPALAGKDAERQQEIDKIMINLDGTQNKSRLGANAMLAVSMAVAKAAAESSILPLFIYLRQFLKNSSDPLKIPVPIFNTTQDGFLVVPASFKSYAESIQIGETIHESLKKTGENTIPDISSNKDSLFLIKQAVDNAHLRLGFDVFLGLDAGVSKNLPNALSSQDLASYYEKLNKTNNLLYLEDPFEQNDWDGWTNLSEKLSESAIIAGGNLIAANPYRLQMALNKKAVNAIVIKPSQVGTVIESLAIAQAAKETGLKTIVSHRSDETNDDFLADFAVAVVADYVKLGNLAMGENIAKYNRLLQIENQLKIL